MLFNRTPSLPHVAKAVRPTVDETLAEIRRIDTGKPPPFNYGAAWRLAYAIYSRAISKTAALKACESCGEVGSVYNAEVVEALLENAPSKEHFCHPLKPRLFPIRQDLAIPVNPKFYFVENDEVFIFWLQPWRTFEFSTESLGVLASVIRLTYAVDDFENAKLHLVDTSAPGPKKPRETKVFGFDDLPLLTHAELTSALGRFAGAYDIHLTTRAPRAERPRKRPDDPQIKLL